MHPTTEQSKDEKEAAEHALRHLTVQLRIAEPLPLEVEPPHVDLRREGRLTIAQIGLAVLAAIEVVHERVVRALREGAGEMQAVATRRRLAFVERWIPRGADGLDGKWCDAKDERADARQDEPPSQERAGTPHDYCDRRRGRGEHAAHVVCVPES